MPRLWSVSHRHNYVTPADFVRGRYDSKPLMLAVAFTGILATMPYIALQLVGIQAVLDVMGIGGSGQRQLAIPMLFDQEFSPWFAGVAFAAIAIRALVPAGIMSIADQSAAARWDLDPATLGQSLR